MTAARDYSSPSKPSRSRRSFPLPHCSQASSVSPSKVAKLPSPAKQLPLALQFLLLVQKSSTTFTFCLIAITLVIYGWTVYVPTLWSQEYSKLKTLQRNERRLVSVNETLKHKLAQKAEKPGSGLTQATPSQSIFLPPTNVAPMSLPANKPSTEKKPLMAEVPVAY